MESEYASIGRDTDVGIGTTGGVSTGFPLVPVKSGLSGSKSLALGTLGAPTPPILKDSFEPSRTWSCFLVEMPSLPGLLEFCPSIFCPKLFALILPERPLSSLFLAIDRVGTCPDEPDSSRVRPASLLSGTFIIGTGLALRGGADASAALAECCRR